MAELEAKSDDTAGNGRPQITVDFPKMELVQIKIQLMGTSPLVCHRWSEKAKREMLDKQQKKAKQAKAPKDPFRDFCESMYWLTPMPTDPTEEDVANARFGFPAVAFKQAAVDACTQIAGITKTLARGAFHVQGEYVEIVGSRPEMREDCVRLQMSGADIRHRGMFPAPWYVELDVIYNMNVISADQIANLFNVGGFAVGVGEGRPQKDRSWGMFKVVGS
jgi:hypothetical protein